MLPGRIIFALFSTKCVVPRQVKPKIIEFSIKKGQSTFSIAFIFVSCKEKTFRWDTSVLNVARTAGANTACKVSIKI